MREETLLNEASALTHNADKEQSDTFTKIAFFGEYLGIVSDFYLYANFIDLVAGNNEDLGGLSYYGIIFGAIVAIASTYGTSLCQNKLNIHLNNLNPSSATRETGYHSITMPQNEADQKPPLSLVEKLLLVSNMIAKASDVASGPLFVIKLLSKNAIQKDIFFIINIIALTLGALCSIANTKSCYVAMLALKGRPELQNTAIEDPKSDRATVDYQEKTPLYTPKSSIFSTDERSDGSMEEPEEVAIIQSINDEPSDLKPAEKPSGILGRMYSLFEGVAEKPSGIFQRLSHWGFFKKPVVTEQTKPAVEGGYDAI